jgi:alkylation response protein AidB-like acyl-CoA dehydrogenase
VEKIMHRISGLVALLLVPTCTLLLAQDSKTADVVQRTEEERPSVTEALQKLQNAFRSTGSALIKQGDLDPLIDDAGGGACPSAAALIAFQSLRLMAGLEAAPNPQKEVLKAFANDKSLLRGRLTNSQFTNLMDFYGRSLDGAQLTLRVISAPNSAHAGDGEKWAADKLPELKVNPGELKILSYTVTTAGGDVRGRHFVILKSIIDDNIFVVDPLKPEAERPHAYLINADKSTGRVFLIPPKELEFKGTLELNTIFIANLTPRDAAGKLIPTESTPLALIKKEIDSLAQKLIEKNDLRSPRTWRTEGARFGLPSLDLPSKYGGANWPASKMVEVFRHVGRYDLNLRDVVGAAHSRVLLKGTSPEVHDIIQQMADGTGYMAIAITEPEAGTDFTALESSCEKVPGGYRLNGTKRFNARLDQATHVVVFTKSNSGKPGRLNVFVLPIDAAGLSIERFGAHGLTGNSFGGLVMKDVFIPESHLIGKEDDGYHIFNDHFRYWRLMQTATAIGTGERALEFMAERLRTRQVYGQPIGRFTHLQQPLGQYSTQLKMAMALVHEAAVHIDRGENEEADVLVCGLKAEGIEIALDAVDAAMRSFGGEGYSDRVDIGDRLRDLLGLRIADGTTDAMRSAVVAKAFGSDFWDMAFKGKGESTPAKSPRD